MNVAARVMTYNIRVAMGSKGDHTRTEVLDAIANEIRRHNPDVVMLQEIDVRTSRSRGMDVLAELASRTAATDAQFTPAIAVHGGTYGVGTLTRNGFVIEDAPDGDAEPNATLRVPLDRSDGKEQRIAQLSSIVSPDGGRMTALNTHLTLHGPTRVRQVRQINAVVDAIRGGQLVQGKLLSGGSQQFAFAGPVIAAGDFNVTSKQLDPHMARSNLRHVLSDLPHDDPRRDTLGSRDIDHIYVDRAATVRTAAVFRPGKLPGSSEKVSDHDGGVIADVGR